MTRRDLEIVLSKGETHTTEFKESADKSIATEVCAFANANGGRIFVGVNDKGQIVGTKTDGATRSRLQDTLKQIEPRLFVDTKICEDVIILTVPEGSYKPYSCPRGFYLRSGPNSQKLDRAGIIDFLQSEDQLSYDQMIRHDLPVDGKLDANAYNSYVKIAKISDVLDRNDILLNLDCAEYVNDKLCFTNAGALFFRANEADVKFRHAGVVCALYKGVDKSHILDAKELAGNIVSNINDALTFLKRHLNVSYKIETPRRKNVLELPEDALREAVINAVCHRNYHEKGARVMVEIYDNRVEIISPGGVCKGITADNFGKVSITRNPIIAGLLFRIGYIEQMGTGIHRMRNASKTADVAEPEFGWDHFFRVVFMRDQFVDDEAVIEIDQPAIDGDEPAIETNEPAIADDEPAIETDEPAIEIDQPAIADDEPAIEIAEPAIGGDKPAIETDKPAIEINKQAIEISDRAAAIINFLRENDRGTNADFANLLGLSPQRTREIQKELIRTGAIEKHGERRYTYYTLKHPIGGTSNA